MGHGMSRLDLAAERFRAALENLENAAGSVGESLDSAAKLPERVAEADEQLDEDSFGPASLDPRFFAAGGRRLGRGAITLGPYAVAMVELDMN